MKKRSEKGWVTVFGLIFCTVVAAGLLHNGLEQRKNADKYDWIVGKYAGRTHAPCQLVADRVDREMDKDNLPHEIVHGTVMSGRLKGQRHVWIEANGKRYDAAAPQEYLINKREDGLKNNV